MITYLFYNLFYVCKYNSNKILMHFCYVDKTVHKLVYLLFSMMRLCNCYRLLYCSVIHELNNRILQNANTFPRQNEAIHTLKPGYTQPLSDNSIIQRIGRITGPCVLSYRRCNLITSHNKLKPSFLGKNERRYL